MREIKLTRGLAAIVDDDVHEALGAFAWYAHGKNGRLYAARRVSQWDPNGKRHRSLLYLHHVIAGKPPTGVIDHINGNPLDNRRTNLRIVSQSVNVENSERSRNGGAWFCPKTSRWVARIGGGSNKRYLGRFPTKDEAVAAARAARSARRTGTKLSTTSNG